MRYAGTIPLLCILLCNSCRKEMTDTSTPGRDAQVCVSAVCSRTRSIADSGLVPCDYTIWLSSRFRSVNSPEADGDYFVGKPFVCGGSLWRSEVPVFWPVGGSLDFLAIALPGEKGQIAGNVKWHSPDCTLGVEIRVDDCSLNESELLYSAAESSLEEGGSVRMEFHHSQAWLQFRIGASSGGLVRIDSVCIRKAYAGGLLRISRGIYLAAEWEFRGFRRRDIMIPGSQALVLQEGRDAVCDILLPEQDACDITVHYSLKAAPESSWEEALPGVCRHSAGADPWFFGTKTIYDIRFRQGAIGISANVLEWEEDNRDITINDN